MDSKYLGSLLLMNEIAVHLFPDDEKYEIFSYLEEGVTNLKNKNDWLMSLLLFLAHVMRVGGYELEVNRCVICGQKSNRIVAFSFIEGGFICEKCINEDIVRDLTKDQMILLRSVINSRDYHLLGSNYSKDNARVLLEKFIDFIQEAFGYHFKNLRLILD